MATGVYSFIDLAVMDTVRTRFVAGDAMLILSSDLTKIIWANGAGADLMGFVDIEEILDSPLGLNAVARRQIAATPGFPNVRSERQITIRLSSYASSQAIGFSLVTIKLPKGEQALLLTTPMENDDTQSETALAHMVKGFTEAGYFAAVIDDSANAIHATDGFEELAITNSTLLSLVRDITHEQDRLVKRLIPSNGNLIPAGIARLSDNPAIHLLIAVNEPIGAIGTEEPEKPVAEVIDSPTEQTEIVETTNSPRLRMVKTNENKPGDEPDDWYFSQTNNPESTQTDIDSSGSSEPEAIKDAVRFVWRTNSKGTISSISKEFLETVGLKETDLIGRSFRDIGRELKLDLESEISGLLERRDTWSGRNVLWPIKGTDKAIPVELAALPVYDRDRVFEGFRGFGVARINETTIDPDARGMQLHVQEDTVSQPAPSSNDKVIRLAERRPAPPQERQLSQGERNALDEIRARLEADFKSRDKRPNHHDMQKPSDSVKHVSGSSENPANPPVAKPEKFLADASVDLIDELPLPLLIHAGDELYFANREFLSLTGYASLEQIKREGGLDRLFVEGDPSEKHEETESKLKLRTLGGTEFPVDAHLQSTRWQGRSALLLAVRRADATSKDYVAHQDSTLITESRISEMRAIIDTATDGVVLIAPDGTIRNISRPAEALFGLDSEDVEGMPFVSLFAIESQRAARDYLSGLTHNGVASVLNDGREVIGREAAGRFIPLFMTIGRLPDDSGFCAVVRDITQWKRAEEELTQARAQAERASKQKTEFLARVSHEIRTPLNAIIGFSELMIDEKFGPVGSDRYLDYLRDINRSGNHVLDLVNDLLDISKIEAGEQDLNYEAVPLNDTLAECVAMMQPQANRERVIIRSSFASRLPDVVADLRSVRQIALNLLSNAVRYTQPGGQVIISTSYEPNGEVTMRVRDTGIGMTLAEIDQALKPFRQIDSLKRGRQDGTGLGLPLTKAMVEANRARFSISSAPNEGTMVEVIFPTTRVLAG